MNVKGKKGTRTTRIITLEEAEVYSPPEHKGTVNHLLLSKEVLGSKNMEIVLGTPTKGSGGNPHSHSESEQAVFVLEGKGLSLIDGKQYEVGPNTLIFHPPGTVHGETALTDDFKVLVIYSPPIGLKDTKAFIPPKNSKEK
jgi:quercetin dioxygenase-like cupin family protein